MNMLIRLVMIVLLCSVYACARPTESVDMLPTDPDAPQVASASTASTAATGDDSGDVIQLAGDTVTSYPRKTGKPYVIRGVTYYPLQDVEAGYQETGIASWYGKEFHAKSTASGEIYDMNAFTAAHKTLPMPTFVRVENLENGKETVVRVNDRGPFAKGRIIDLSYAAAMELGMTDKGTAKVRITVLSESQDSVRTEGVDVDINKGNFYVQIGAFAVETNATTLAAKHKASRVVPVTTLDGQRLLRVQIQGYTTKNAATNALREYEQTYPDAFIVAD